VQAAYQTTRFQDFQQGYAVGGSSSTIYDGRDELKGVLEVADIVDELKMIRHLLQVQRDVLKLMASALTRLNPSRGPRTEVSNKVILDRIRVSENASLIVTVSAGGITSDSIETTKILAQGIYEGGAKQNVISTDERLLAVLAGLDGIKKEAEYTHRMVSIQGAPSCYSSHTICSCLICSI
jgi:hypothetical protein